MKRILFFISITSLLFNYNLYGQKKNASSKGGIASQNGIIELSVSLTPRTKIFSRVFLDSMADIKDYAQNQSNYTTCDFYKIGNITSGQYKGGQLVFVVTTSQVACDNDCASYSRFLLYNKTAIFLSRISSRDVFDTINPFIQFGFTTFIKNDYLTIPALEYPQPLVGISPCQVLATLVRENDDKLDVNTLVKIASNKDFGTIYCTKPRSGPSFKRILYDEGEMTGYTGNNDDFYVFRPDGTSLHYVYTPDFTFDGYGYNVSIEESGLQSGWTLINRKELIVDKNLTTVKDTFYIFRNNDHIWLKDFYQHYAKTYSQLLEDAKKERLKYRPSDDSIGKMGVSSDVESIYLRNTHPLYAGSSPITYEQFITNKPLVFYRDPFGRLLCFRKIEFLGPRPPWDSPMRNW